MAADSAPKIVPHQRPSEEEEDQYELMMKRSGCYEHHVALQDCFFDKGKDWRLCQTEMKQFKDCMSKQKREKEV